MHMEMDFLALVLKDAFLRFWSWSIFVAKIYIYICIIQEYKTDSPRYLLKVFAYICIPPSVKSESPGTASDVCI